MKDKLIKLYYNQQFNPHTILGILLNPFYFARLALHKNIKKLSASITGDCLDVGCGKKPYKHLFTTNQYIGMDIEQTGHTHQNEDIDVFYDGITFPFPNERFDSIICNQVLEHVFNPDEFLNEINRVLKQGGYILLTVPFVWDEHEQPYDFARYSSFGLKSIFEKHGFKVRKQIKSVPNIKVLFQLLNGYIYKKTHTKNGFINLLITAILISPFTLMGLILGLVTPNNNDLYLDNVILAQKNKHA